MSKVDWSKAPPRAVCYANELFWEHDKDTGKMRFFVSDDVSRYHGSDMIEISSYKDFETRSLDWPSEQRIDIVGTNGGDGAHYNAPERTTSDEIAKPVSAADFLSEGLKTLSERGKQYDPSGKKELSFNQVAEAFNAVTGKSITGADICLMLVMLKIVRQNATEGFHMDSAVDGVNYMALWAELLAAGPTTN